MGANPPWSVTPYLESRLAPPTAIERDPWGDWELRQPQDAGHEESFIKWSEG